MVPESLVSWDSSTLPGRFHNVQSFRTTKNRAYYPARQLVQLAVVHLQDAFVGKRKAQIGTRKDFTESPPVRQGMPLECQGLFAHVMLFSSESPRPGWLLYADGSPVSDAALLASSNAPTDRAAAAFQGLLDRGVLKRGDGEALYAPYLVRVAERKREFQELGRMGGNPALRHKPPRITETDNSDNRERQTTVEPTVATSRAPASDPGSFSARIEDSRPEFKAPPKPPTPSDWTAECVALIEQAVGRELSPATRELQSVWDFAAHTAGLEPYTASGEPCTAPQAVRRAVAEAIRARKGPPVSSLLKWLLAVMEGARHQGVYPGERLASPAPQTVKPKRDFERIRRMAEGGTHAQ